MDEVSTTIQFGSVLWAWLGLALFFAALWIVAVRETDAGWVDFGWSLSLGLVVLGYAFVAPGDPWRRVLLAVLTGAWSLRLAWYLLQDRILKAEAEDGRYQQLRAHWGNKANRWFFFFFQGQAFANVLLGLPHWILMSNPQPLGLWDAAGGLVFLAAILGERAADEQLQRWRREPRNRGRTCRLGLWRYSRHPNYFFEWLHWLAYPVMGVGLWGAGLGSWWLLTLAASVVMLVLLLGGTGIPYTEKQAIRSRGEDYRRYQREVSAFFPWFPRDSSGGDRKSEGGG